MQRQYDKLTIHDAMLKHRVFGWEYECNDGHVGNVYKKERDSGGKELYKAKGRIIVTLLDNDNEQT